MVIVGNRWACDESFGLTFIGHAGQSLRPGYEGPSFGERLRKGYSSIVSLLKPGAGDVLRSEKW